MPKLPRHVVVASIAAASVLAGAILVFSLHRLTSGGGVLGGVVVSGVDIGGLREAEALTRLTELEDEIRRARIAVLVGTATFQLELRAIDFSIDKQAILAEAMANGRGGNVAGQFAWWLSHLFSGPVELTLPYAYDADALDDVVAAWESEGIADPPFQGEVAVVDDEVVYRYPAAGIGIDREAAIELISESLADPTHPPVELPTRLIEPAVTAEDVDRAVLQTRRLLEHDATLVDDAFGKEVVIPREVLGRALTIELDETGAAPEFVFRLESEPLVDYLDRFSDFLETEPVDAEIVIDVEDDTVTIVPSLPAHEVDDEALADAVWEAMTSPTRSGSIPWREGDEAAFSTADAEALGIKGLLGEFTTHHACCQNRVHNIQLMARTVDGALVMPGDTFSLNDHVGQRTTEKGYRCGGALVGGELVEEGAVCIGGGTSQFTTTLHNAVFFSGLEHVRFTPHSAWFNRYPEGREATIGWREPEYIFRNDTEHAIVIRTTHTDTSITVKIYGDNGGLEVEADLSPRRNFSAVIERTRRNPEMNDPEACTAATAKTIQSGHGGWSVTVYRHITRPGGDRTTEEWHWHYTGLYRIKEFNPDAPSCQEPEPEEPEDPEDPGDGDGDDG